MQYLLFLIATQASNVSYIINHPTVGEDLGFLSSRGEVVKPPALIAGLLIPLSVVSALIFNSKARIKTDMATKNEVLQIASEMFTAQKNLNLIPIECKVIFGYEVNDDAKCYSSDRNPVLIADTLHKSLDKIGYTNGWRDDYGVQGAFYVTKADPKMTFGVTVTAIEGSMQYEDIAELKGRVSIVTVTSNLRSKF